MQKNVEVESFGGFAMKMGKAGYPKNWPDWGVFGRQIIKSILKTFEFTKTDNMLLSEIEFRREARCRFLEIQKF